VKKQWVIPYKLSQIVRGSRGTRPPDVLMHYLSRKTVIPVHLDYLTNRTGIEIYGNTNPSNINRLKILNNKILRILQKSPRHTHIIDLYKSYSTLPIDLLHKYQIGLLLFVHKFSHHSNRLSVIFASYFTQSKLIHHHDTWDKCDFHLSIPCTTSGKRSLKYKGSHLWNRLPESLKLIQSIPVFKSSLMVFLLTTV